MPPDGGGGSEKTEVRHLKASGTFQNRETGWVKKKKIKPTKEFPTEGNQ